MNELKKAVEKNWKRYLISSGVTFISIFLIVIVSEIDNITLGSFRNGVMLGILFSAIRAGIKGILEVGIKELAIYRK